MRGRSTRSRRWQPLAALLLAIMLAVAAGYLVRYVRARAVGQARATPQQNA